MNTNNKLLAWKNNTVTIQQGLTREIAEFLSEQLTESQNKIRRLVDCIEKEISKNDNRTAVITYIQEVIAEKKITVKRSEGVWLKLNVNNANELEEILNILKNNLTNSV